MVLRVDQSMRPATPCSEEGIPAFFLTVLLFTVAHRVSPLELPLDWKALTLMPVGAALYPLGVEWTLVFEIAFYVFVFVIMALSKNEQMPVIVAAWLGLILPRWTSLRVHPVLAAIVAVDLWLLGAQLLGLTGVRWGMGFGAALLVVALARFQGWRPVFGDTVVGRFGNRLGDYSYALYLCHVPVIRTIYAVAPPSTSNKTLFVLAIILAPLLSVVLGEIDIRLYRTLKARVDVLDPRPRMIMVTVYLVPFFALELYFGFFGAAP